MKHALCLMLFLPLAFACKKSSSASSKSSINEKDVSIVATDEGEKDLLVVEDSMQFAGSSLQGISPNLEAQEIGAAARSIKLDFDSVTQSVTAKFPNNGYFIIDAGDKVAVVAPSEGSLELSFRRFHKVTAKLMELAAKGEGQELFDNLTVDLGAFAFWGQIVYRASRRHPELLEESKLQNIVNYIVRANRELVGSDTKSNQEKLKQAVSSSYAGRVVTARGEIDAARRMSSAIREGAASDFPFSLHLNELLNEETDAVLRDAVNEAIYADSVSRFANYEKIPASLLEGLSMSVWRQIQDSSGEQLKSETVSKLRAMVIELDANAAQPEVIAAKVYANRKWRPSQKFNANGMSVLSGSFLRPSTGGIYLIYTTATPGVPYDLNNPISSIYFQQYFYGSWSPAKIVTQDVTLSSHTVNATCVASGCFVAWTVGADPVGGATTELTNFARETVHLGVIDSSGSFKEVANFPGKSPALRSIKDPQHVELALIEDKKLHFLTINAEGQVVVTKSLTDKNYVQVLSRDFGTSSAFFIRTLESATTGAGTIIDIWGQYLRFDDQDSLFRMPLNLHYPLFESADLLSDRLAVTYVDQHQLEDSTAYRGSMQVVDVSGAQPMHLQTAATATSQKRLSSEALVPGRFGACGLTDENWYLIWTAHEASSTKLFGMGAKLPLDSDKSASLLDTDFRIGGVLDCSYQQSLFWIARTDQGDILKTVDIDETGVDGQTSEITRRNMGEPHILGMTTFSNWEGFRVCASLESDSLKIGDPTTKLDRSAVDLKLFFFE